MDKLIDIKKQEKTILLVFIIAILLYGVSVFFTDVKKIQMVLSSFHWRIVPIVLLFTLVNYFFRGLRFHLLLKKIKVPISFGASFRIFCAGIAMTVTPGKMGEVIKAYFLKKEKDVSYAEVVPILIFERLTDGIAMIILSIGGLYFFPQGRPFFILASLCVVVGIFFLMGKTHVVSYLHTHKLMLIPSKVKKFLVSFFDHSYKLLTPWVIIYSVFLGVVAWALEGISLFLIMRDLTSVTSVVPDLLNALLIFSFSSIAGFLVLIPGGVGVAEGSLTSLLVVLFKVSIPSAIFATVVFRLTTLWFGVFLGLIFLLLKMRNLTHSQETKTKLQK